MFLLFFILWCVTVVANVGVYSVVGVVVDVVVDVVVGTYIVGVVVRVVVAVCDDDDAVIVFFVSYAVGICVSI